MAELKVHSEGKTPTEMITTSNESAVVQAGGKSITLKKPGVLAQYRIVEAVGDAAAKNQVYMSMVMPLLWVVEIDGHVVPQISKKVELEALIQRLGDDGVQAVIEHTNRQYEEAAPSQEAVKN